MKIIKTLFTGCTILAASIGSVAANTYYDYAKVVRVEPIYHYVTISQPVEQCYPVERRTYRRAHRDNAAPTLMGAVIGGVIGNAIGDNRASTVAGAIIGGSIGHNANHSYSRVEQHCEVAYTPTKKVRKIKGYNVKYRYQGDAFTTFMRQHPGDKVKVRVRVSPAGYP